MRCIEDVRSQGGKFVTNQVPNEEEVEDNPQADKLEKVISGAV